MNSAEMNKEHHHITPLKIYLGVAASLFVLTIITVMVAQINLGGWNAIVAVAIATIKATLVAMIFMHLLYDKKIFLVIFSVALVFLAIFISFTMFDIVSRGNINIEAEQPIQEKATMYQHIETDSSKTQNESHGDTPKSGH